MGQEASCCRQRSAEQGIERIFDNNYQISRETIQVLGNEGEKFNPSRKPKLIKLHKVQCEDNQAKPQLHNRINSMYHSRNMSSSSQTLPESTFNRLGDNNQLSSFCDVKGNMNGNNPYLSSNTYNYSTIETLHNFQTQPNQSNQLGVNQAGYVTSPSSNELDQFQQVASVPAINPMMAAVINSDQIYTVRETYIDGSTYEGEKLNEFRHGYGVFVFSNKACYKGSWNQDKMNGRGLLYYSSGQLAYQGQFAENKFEGYGYLNNEVIDYNLKEDDDKFYQDFSTIGSKWIKYEGEFQNDSKNGRGRLYLSNGDFIQADFMDDKIHGDCILFKSNHTIIKGFWRENKLVRITH